MADSCDEQNNPDPWKRGSKGQFGSGNRGGKGGNPQAARAAKLRAAMMGAMTPEALVAAVEALVSEAATGNVAACRELFDRACGRPEPLDLIERLEQAEQLLAKLQLGTRGAS